MIFWLQHDNFIQLLLAKLTKPTKTSPRLRDKVQQETYNPQGEVNAIQLQHLAADELADATHHFGIHPGNPNLVLYGCVLISLDKNPEKIQWIAFYIFDVPILCRFDCLVFQSHPP